MILRCVSFFAAWLVCAASTALAAGDTLESCLLQPQSTFLGFDRQNRPITMQTGAPAPADRTLKDASGVRPLPPHADAPIVRASGQGGGVLLFTDTAGNERYRLLYQAGGAQSPIQVSAPGARAASPIVLPGGDGIVYTSTAGEDRLWGVLEYSDRATTRILFQEAGAWQAISASADGNTLLIQEVFGLYDRVLYSLDRRTGLKTPLFLGKRPFPIRGAALSPDGQTAYVLLANANQQGLILKAQGYEGKIRPLLTTPWPLYDIALNADGDRLIAFENRNGETWVHSVNPNTADRPAPTALGGWASDLAIAPSGASFGYTIQRPGSAPAAQTQPAQVITVPAAGQACAAAKLNAIDLNRSVPVAGKATLPALLIEPTAPPQGPRPILIAFHGGPEGQWLQNSHRAYFAMAESLDIAILLPNIVGSTGYGLFYSAADDGIRRTAVLNDIELLLEWIAADPRFDAQKIGVTGASYGGYVALLAQSQFNHRIAGAVSEVGIADLGLFLSETPITRRALRRAEYGDERGEKVAKALTALSPITHAGAITKPVFLTHGRNDARVPVNQSILMQQALTAKGTSVQLTILDGEGHIVRDPQTRLNLARNMQAFWSSLLKPLPSR